MDNDRFTDQLLFLYRRAEVCRLAYPALLSTMKQILKVLVGSQAHGLANEASDFDYRGVFVLPTSKLLTLGADIKQTKWIEGNEDDTSWELFKFLLMAVKANPTVLECFLAPIVDADSYGLELRNLFPYVWSSENVYKAFLGYGHQQRKKFLERKDDRPHKYAAAYLRVVYQGTELLRTGTSFPIKISDTIVGPTVAKFKARQYTVGEVMEVCYEWEKKLEEAYLANANHQVNYEKINEFIMKVRKEYWNE